MTPVLNADTSCDDVGLLAVVRELGRRGAGRRARAATRS